MDNRQLDRIALDRELVKRHGLRKFVELAWPIIEPGPLVPNWHIDVICERLEACFDRQIRKLVINVPPGTMKTKLASVLYPAWCWAEDPTESFLYASFDQGLMDNAAREMRNIVASDWFQERWPEARLPKLAVRQVREFRNAKGGWRFSTSVGGKGTGKHPHQRVIDDPIKPADTIGGSDVTRRALQACELWYQGTISTRQADPATTLDILIMQRLHDADLAGILLSKWAGEVEHCMLPMHYNPARAYSYDRRTAENELLWPARFPEAEVDKLSAALGQFADAQLEQDPVAKEGGTFKSEWIKYWSPGGAIPNTVSLPPIGSDLQSWDCAFKGKDSSDPACGGVWRRAGGRFYLLDLEWDRWNFPELLAAVRRLCGRWPKVIHKIVEDKANGPAVCDSLMVEFPGFELVNPEGGKEARANSVAPLFKAGLVFLPHPSLHPKVEELVRELTRFPRGLHDDGVDMTTQALLKLYIAGPKLAEVMEAWRQGDPTLKKLLGGNR